MGAVSDWREDCGGRRGQEDGVEGRVEEIPG